ncbi:hypothetical protein [Planococcus sp. YIM B11945]|uniref:hypothetical protein n=1 Tax=Planococcus sp. YIM B11945 TaxID=3435410 RepID=UPI003D7CFF44
MEIYLVFTDTKTPLARLVKTCTQHTYGHVSLSFDPNLETMYSFGRKDVENAFVAGFVQEDVQNRLFQRAYCAVYRCTVSKKGYWKMWAYVKNMEKQKDLYKYNLSGLFGVLLQRNFDRKDAFFCSQFVATVLSEGGIRVSDKPANLVSPRDIYLAAGLKIVYCGPMNEYPMHKKELFYYENKRGLMSAL